jgi:hypothetical protein
MSASVSATTALYDLSINECAEMIESCRENTMLIQGRMGIGKSSILKMLAKRHPTHTPCYFDCTTKDLGDITIPQLHTLDGDSTCVRYVPNEELGIHLNKPLILMVDEFGKANPAVKNGMMRLLLERKLGSYTLHPDSMVFATTNLGSEGLGDLLLGHHRNRITITRMRGATNTEWITEYAYNAGIHPAMIACVSEKPEWFASFEDVANPQDNQYIMHPGDKSRVSFVTLRSLEAASRWLYTGKPRRMLMAALIGCIGAKAAGELVTFYDTAQDMPTPDSIKVDPFTAKIPSTDAATCMVVHRTLATIGREWVDQWMDYMSRLDMEAQLLFMMQVKRDDYAKRTVVLNNAKARAWCLANNFAFGADK